MYPSIFFMLWRRQGVVKVYCSVQFQQKSKLNQTKTLTQIFPPVYTFVHWKGVFEQIEENNRYSLNFVFIFQRMKRTIDVFQ